MAFSSLVWKLNFTLAYGSNLFKKSLSWVKIESKLFDILVGFISTNPNT